MEKNTVKFAGQVITAVGELVKELTESGTRQGLTPTETKRVLLTALRTLGQEADITLAKK